jgi:hypothetical protein
MKKFKFIDNVNNKDDLRNILTNNIWNMLIEYNLNSENKQIN